MPLLPRALRPAAVIRNRALWRGILGPSRFWRVVAVWVFGRSTLKKLFGKNPEILDTSTLGAGRYLSVETSRPVTRRQARKLAKRGTPGPTLADLTTAATALAAATVAARRRK